MMLDRPGNVIDAKDGSGSESGGSGGPKMVTTDAEALKKVGVAGADNHV